MSSGAWAQFTQKSGARHGAPTFWHPESNIAKPADAGLRAHTNVIGGILPEANAKPPKLSSSGGLTPDTVPVAGYYYETPSSLACVYGFIAQTTGCNPTNSTAVVTGGAGLTIAIVIAYDNPGIQTDLATFDAQFGLPAPTGGLTVVYASGSQPVANPGWALESSLDVEWSHAMSPNAHIILVEAASNSYTDLMAAVKKASSLVAAAGGGVVSMSWGGSEFSNETSYDSYFQTPNVTYIASSGDAPGVIWPSASAYVIAAGGTSLSRNPANGNFVGELTWTSAGSGFSAYVARPSYQTAISSVVGAKRGVPDIAAVADPSTGVWVKSSYNSSGWYAVGGTSVASPVLAGILSHKGSKYASAAGALNAIYNGSIGNFRDITSGNCGPYDGYLAGMSWDLCTGRGSLLGSLRLYTAGATPIN